jgi:hypothetical protein
LGRRGVLYALPVKFDAGPFSPLGNIDSWAEPIDVDSLVGFLSPLQPRRVMISKRRTVHEMGILVFLCMAFCVNCYFSIHLNYVFDC